MLACSSAFWSVLSIRAVMIVMWDRSLSLMSTPYACGFVFGLMAVILSYYDVSVRFTLHPVADNVTASVFGDTDAPQDWTVFRNERKSIDVLFVGT
jgi:hypothetical protein